MQFRVCLLLLGSAAINLKSDFAASYMYLAITLARLEDFDNACSAYDKVRGGGGGRGGRDSLFFASIRSEARELYFVG